MKISKLIETLQKCLEEHGDVDIVKFDNYKYVPLTKILPIMRQETLGITDPAVSKAEVY